MKTRAGWSLLFAIAMATAGIVLFSEMAGAQPLRAYISDKGPDVNACGVPFPAATPARAMRRVPDIEISMLDSANFGGSPTTTDRSVTIPAAPGAQGIHNGSSAD